MSLDLSLPGPAATEALGFATATGAGPGRVLHLRGDLGSGKTTLVRGLLRALGHTGRVKSPTYTLVEPYELSSLHLYHFDFYRLKDRSEWSQQASREYFPPLHVRCGVAGTGRGLAITARREYSSIPGQARRAGWKQARNGWRRWLPRAFSS